MTAPPPTSAAVRLIRGNRSPRVDRPPPRSRRAVIRSSAPSRRATAHAPATQDGLDRGRRGPGLPGEIQEWRLAHQHLVQHARQAVQVGAGVDRAAAHQLLGAHVCERPDRLTRGGQRLPGGRAGRTDRPRDAEIRDEGLVPGQEDVLRLDVAVDHAVAVRVTQCIGHLEGDVQRVFQWQRLFPREADAQRLARDVRHDVIAEPVRSVRHKEAFVCRENRHDMRVAELRGKLHFADEALAEGGVAQLGGHHLDRHRAGGVAFVGQIHAGHPPRPDLALHRVVGSQAFAQGRQDINHHGRSFHFSSG